jgi:hypothetical protein
MRDIELELRNLPFWRESLCEKSSKESRRACDPGISLAAVAWPSRSYKYGKTTLVFDGKGTELLSLPALMKYLRRTIDFKYNGLAPRPHYQLYFPKSFTPDGGAPPAAFRTHFKFRIRVGQSGMPTTELKANMEKEKELYQDFIRNEVYPILIAAKEKYKHIRVYYSGDELGGYDIEYTLFNDRWFAIASFLFVVWYTWVHTGTLWLSAISLFVVFLSIPLAYVLTPSSGTTIVSLLSLFLITGVGSDVVFVFNDMWRQSRGSCDRERKSDYENDPIHLSAYGSLKEVLIDRVKYTIIHAGSSCSATSMTTAVSFLANLASALQSLREFGLFMGLCVLCAFALCLLVLPPLFVVRELRSIPHINSREVDIARGQIDSLGLFVIADEQPSGGICRRCKKNNNVDEQGRKMPKSQAFLFNLVGWISKCPLVIFILVIIWFACCLVGLYMTAEMATGVPDLFPADHNQVEGVKMFGKFVMLESGITAWCEACANERSASCYQGRTIEECSGTICDPHSAENVVSPSQITSSCMLMWCLGSEAIPAGTADSSRQVGSCYRGSLRTSNFEEAERSQCQSFAVSLSIVGPEGVNFGRWQPQVAQITQDALNWHTDGIVDNSPTNLDLAMEDWDSGSIIMAEAHHVGKAMFYAITPTPAPTPGLPTPAPTQAPPTPASPASEFVVDTSESTGVVETTPRLECFLQTTCYVSALKCEADDMEFVNQYTVDGSRRSLSETNLSISGDGKLVALQSPIQRGSPLLGFSQEDEQLELHASLAARPGRLLQQIDRKNRVDITVLWGVLPPLTTPLVGKSDDYWRFDPTFDITDPWAQRTIMKVCWGAGVPALMRATNDKGAPDQSCWAEHFRSHLKSMGKEFPSRTFDADLASFWNKGVSAQQNFWIDGGKAAATKVWFRVNVATTANRGFALEYMKEWDRFIKGVMDSAPVTAKRAYHTASIWVRVEAEAAIIGSTLDTIMLSAGNCWLGVLLFTRLNICMALIVLGLVLGVISSLGFFMTVLMGWKIGPIEVISLVVFVGYSVTYMLHIAHHYSITSEADEEAIWSHTNVRHAKKAGEKWVKEVFSPKKASRRNSFAVDEAGNSPKNVRFDLELNSENSELDDFNLRVARTRMAVVHFGGATASSAVSTMGCSAFLLFCTITVFVKLGAVVLAVTLLSILYALVCLPATLILLGPTYHHSVMDNFKVCQDYIARKNNPRDEEEEPLDID